MNRFNFVKNFKAYTMRMKDQRKQNMAIFRSYLKKQRSIIVQNTRRRIFRGIFWMGVVSVSYYVAHRLYSQKLQVQQMEKKLTKLYPNIVTKIDTDGNHEVYYVVPDYSDQLTSVIEMCWKYHYKVIVNSDFMDPHMKNDEMTTYLTGIPETIKDKCVIVNLSKLNASQFDIINGWMKVESGMTCKELNQRLEKAGYRPFFHEQIASNPNQTVYNAIVSNYPTINGPLSNFVVNFDIISPQGHYFRSSNENNQYGSTPNLNTIFLGTGGIFGLPIRTNFKLEAQIPKEEVIKTFEVDSSDLNQKLLTTRKIREILSSHKEQVQFGVVHNDENKVEIKLKVKKANTNILEGLKEKFRLDLPDLKEVDLNQAESESTLSKESKRSFNIFFNSNQAGFQKFLVFRHNKNLPSDDLRYEFSQNLLKVNCPSEEVLLEVVSEVCSQNGVIVWCKDHKFMKEIKKATDTSEVGSELMKILVQIREGIDHKKIYYTHNRYEEYFAKSTFRKLTEVFW